MTEAKCCGCNETSEEEMLRQLDNILDDYQKTAGALIPVLQIAQNMFGYLPEAALKKISVKLNKPFSEVAGVVGFYSFFSTQPRGKYLVRVCLGTACYVKGSKQIIDNIEKELGLKVGGITKDRKFSLEAVRCLGCCSLAPAMVIDDNTHALVEPSEAVRIVQSYE